MKKTIKTITTVMCAIVIMAVLMMLSSVLFDNISSYAQENTVISISVKTGLTGNAGHTINDIMDGDTGTKYFVEHAFDTDSTSQRTPYIVFEASQAVTITGYSITTGDDTATYSDRNPKSWVLLGSNSYNSTDEPDYTNIKPSEYSTANEPSNWTILDQVDDDTVLQATSKTKYSFDIDTDNQGEYKYYKLVIYKSNGGENIQLAEFGFVYDSGQFFTVESSSGGNSGEGADKLFDGKKSDGIFSKWCINYTAGNYVNVIFKAKTPIVVYGYTFVTGNDNQKYNGRNPKSWVLAGATEYNGSDTSWYSIDNVSNDTTMEDKNYTSYTFMVENSRSYQYYMLQISANQGANVIQLAELELIYSDCEHEWVEDDQTSATCTTYLYKNYTCSKCNESISVLSGEPLGHDFVTETTDDATCTIAQKLHQKCSRCDATQTIDGDAALGHDWSTISSVDATCTKAQQLNQECSRCDATQTIDGEEALGHSWSEESDYCTIITEPTCTTTGVKSYKCTVEGCEGTKTETVDALGHDWGTSPLVSNATCSNECVMQHTCATCNVTEKYSKGLPLGHEYQNGKCVRCGKAEDSGVTVGAFVVIGGEKDVDYKYEENIKSVSDNKHSSYNVLTILSSTNLTISNVDPDTATTTDRIFIAKDVSANITLAGVNIDLSWESYDNSSNLGDSAISMADNSTGDVLITLASGTINYAKSGKSSAGIQKNSPYGSLTINGTGTLYAYGGQNASGIGSGRGSGADLATMCVTNITIEDCTIIAKGSRITSGGVASNNGNYGAAPGIGSGSPSAFSSSVSYDANIRIVNATVTAEGVGSSGIGPAGNGHMGGIVIEGGSVLSTQSSVCKNTSVNDAIGGISSKLKAPTNSNGVSVYLLTLANPNGKIITIDGDYYVPIAHSANDTSVYLYLTGTSHSVWVGDSYYYYEFDSENKSFTQGTATGSEIEPKAFTVTATKDDTITIGTDYTYADGVLTILSDTPMTINSSGLPTTDRIVINADGAEVTLNNVYIDVSEITDNPMPALLVNGYARVYIYLASGSVNTLKSGYGCAGLQIVGTTTNDDTTFIQGISSDSASGILNAYGGTGGAGIGSANNGTVGTIYISWYATINAYGGSGAAGIGSGSGMSATYTVISIGNSNILAVGGDKGAGIGSGYNASVGSPSSITIEGSVVSAIGGKDANGIGHGQLAGGNSSIVIRSATVYALGGSSDGSTAGYGISGSEIKITESSVNAIGGLDDSGSQKSSFNLTPVNSGDSELNLLVVANPEGKNVKVDGVEWYPSSSAEIEDTNLYLYLTGSDHVVKVGDTVMNYYYIDGTFHLSSGNYASGEVDGKYQHWYTCADDGCDVKLVLTECTASEDYSSDDSYHWHSCSVCGQALSKTEHIESEEYFSDESYHWHTCTVCGVEVSKVEHTYDQKVEKDTYIYKSATCLDNAWYYKSCVCGHCEKDENNIFSKSGSQLEHNFVYPEGEKIEYIQYDEDHEIVCYMCKLIGKGVKEEHIYEHGCSTNCSVCDCPRTEGLVHDYDTTTWVESENGNGHVHKCKYCDGYTDYADHIFTENNKDNYETEYQNGVYKHGRVCTVCGIVDGDGWEECYFVYKNNDTNHWYECSTCGFEKPNTNFKHTFDNDCDTDCNDGCGYTRTITHNYDETTWFSDDKNHWHECSVCGDKKDEAQHLLTTDYDADGHWERCTVCEKTKINYSQHSYNSGEYTCNGCGYVSATPIITDNQPRLNFTLSGYEVGGNTKNFKVISDENNFGINWDNDKICGYYWWIITDFEDYMTDGTNNSTIYSYWSFDSFDNTVNYVEVNNYLRPNTNYWVALYLEADDDHFFDGFRQGNVYIEGLGYPIYVYSESEDWGYVYAYFELPILEGEVVELNQMPDIEFELTGNYTLGESILTKDITENTVLNFEVAPSGINRTWALEYHTILMIENSYSSNASFYSGVFEEETSYGIKITVFAPEGYDFASYDQDSITLKVGDTVCTAYWYDIYCEGKCGAVEYYFYLPILGEHEHTWIWGSWGEDSHYKECSVCGEYDYSASWEHVYDDDNDFTCNDCGYIRNLYVKELNFNLSDYELGKPVNGVGITPSEGSEMYILTQEGQYALQIIDYYYLLDGEITNRIEIDAYDTSRILAGEKYIIMFYLAPAIYYTNDNNNSYYYNFESILSENIKIDGVSALTTTVSSGYLMVMAELPVLSGDDGVSRITDVECALTGYELDEKLSDLSLTPVKITGIEDYTLSITYNGTNFDRASTPDLTFSKDTTYRIEIILTAKENYSFINLTESGLKINGTYELEYFKLLDAEGKQLNVVYSLLDITEPEHTHYFYSGYGGYDSYHHWYGCECGMKCNVEEHIFVEGSLKCTKCGYDSSNVIKNVTLYLDNYEYDGYARNIVVSHTDTRLEDIDSFGSGFNIGTSISVRYGDSGSALSKYDYLSTGIEYYLAVLLDTSSSDYCFYKDLTVNDIVLEGHGTAVDVILYDSCYIMVTFKLKALAFPHVHTWNEENKVDEVPSTCGTEGTVAHYICETCGKAVDKEGKELSASDLAIAKNPDAHTYVIQYDSSYHVKVCKDCGHYSEAGYHTYDNGSDCTCNFDGCGYVREKLPENIEFSISDYVIGGKITDIKVDLSDEAEGLYWESNSYSTVSYADYWWRIITDLDMHFAEMNADGHNSQNGNYCTATGGYFRPDTDYWLIVWIEAYDGRYRLTDLTNEDIYLDGVGIAMYFDTYYVDDGDQYGYAYFKLPTLSGDCDIKTMPDIELELNGYEIDSAIENATITLGADYAVSDASMDFVFNVQGTSYPSSGELFSDSKYYVIRILILAGEGYDFYGFTADDLSIKGMENIVISQFILYPGYSGIYALIELPTLEHTHTYGEWLPLTDSETQHYKSCETCGHKIYGNHNYDDESDSKCNDCGYERTIAISSLKFVLSGYELDASAGGVTITVAEGYEKYIFSDEENGYSISLEAIFYSPDGQLTSSSMTQFSSYFLSGPEYAVVMTVKLSDGYTFAESPSITLSGTESSFISSISGNKYMIIFVLPKLTGEGQIKKVNSIEYTLKGYELGEKIADLSLEAVNDTGVEILDIDILYGESLTRFDATATPDLTFALNTRYYIAIQIKVDETHTFVGTTADTFKLNGNVVFNSIGYNDAYTEVLLTYVLQELVEEDHVHQYGRYYYNESVHWLSCDCFAQGEESEHIFDDDFDDTCNVCGYTRKIELTSITLYLSGYMFGNYAEDISVTHVNQCLQWFSGDEYGYYFYLSTNPDLGKTSLNGLVEKTERIQEGVEYYLAVLLVPQSASLYSLKADNIILYGYGSALQTMDVAGYLYALFELPVLSEPHVHEGVWNDEKPATCINTGVVAHRECTICGKYFDAEGKEITDLTIPINPNAHNYGKWVTEVPATCIATGVKGYKDCTLCGKHFDNDGNEIDDLTIAINPEAHNYNGTIAHKDPTCTDNGIVGGTYCILCNDGKAEAEKTIEPLGHNSDGSIAHKDATCTDTGVVGGSYCTRCNEGKEQAEAIIPTNGHNYGDWVTEVPATCIATGVKGYKDCTLCGKHFDNDGNEIDDLTIAINPEAHNYNGTIAHKDPTCTDNGIVGGTYCTLCNDGKAEAEKTIEPLGHNSDGSIAHKDATCTDTGVVGGSYCTRCNDGKEQAEAIIPANGHNYGDWVTEVPATCIATGVKGHYQCSVCKTNFDLNKNVLTDLIIALVDHNVSTDWSYSSEGHWHECTQIGCSYREDESAHVPDRDAPGEYVPVKCKDCEYIITPATGHVHKLTYVSATVATCLKDGTKAYYTCSGCTDRFEDINATTVIQEFDSWVVVKGTHAYGEWIEELPATCSKEGIKAHKDCTVCGKHFNNDNSEILDIVIPKDLTNHSFGEWIEESPATCSSAGIKGHFTCGLCGKYFDVDNCEIQDLIIPNDETKHSLGDWVAEVPATCVSTGTKGHYVCTLCEKSFDSQGLVIDDIILSINDNHNYSSSWSTSQEGHWHECIRNGCTHRSDESTHIPDREAATEEEPVKCSVCGYIITPATGHIHHLTYVEEVSATCLVNGRKAYYACSGCENKFENVDDIEPIENFNSWVVIIGEHSFGEWIDEVPATCITAGVKGHNTCEYCEKNFDSDGNILANLTIAINSDAHALGEWIDELPATCTTSGVKGHKECSTCGTYFDANGNVLLSVVVPELGHDFTGEWCCSDEGHWHECTRNGCENHSDVVAHTPNRSEVTEDDAILCTVCGFEIEPATGHIHHVTYEDGEQATCCSKAICSKCKEAYGEFDFTNHSSIVKVERVEATVTSAGNIEYFMCLGCNKCFGDKDGVNIIASDSVILPKLAPSIVEGMNEEWNRKKGGLSFKSNSSIEDFETVLVDGVEIDSSNYSIEEGEVKITLSNEFLSGLDEGEHEIIIRSSHGDAVGSFLIVRNGLSAGAWAGISISIAIVISGGIALLILFKKNILTIDMINNMFKKKTANETAPDEEKNGESEN